MLTNEQLDAIKWHECQVSAFDVFVDGQVCRVMLKDIIAQAKLANRIQKKAAEICAKEARIYYGTSIDGPASSIDYQRGLAADNCAAAILAMEVKADSKLAQTTKDPIITQAKTPAFNIVINGVRMRWTDEEISYENVCANGNLHNYVLPFVAYTITYAHPCGDGILARGQKIKCRENMVFNAFITNNA